MQWAKAKTIMIWLFLAVDIILAAVLAANKVNNGKNDKKMLIKIMESNNISVREEILDFDRSQIFAYEFTGLELTQDLAENFIKNPVKADNNTYESEDEVARITFNSGYLTYESQAPKMKGFSGVNEKNVHSRLSPYLKKLGVNKYVKLTNVFKQNEDIYAEYSYFFDDMELFSSKLSFVVNKDGIKRIYGNINIPNEKRGYNFTLSNIETVLLNFVQNNNFTSKETVVSITEGYYCINYENIVLSQAIPVYRIKTSNKTYIYDARDGIDAGKRQLWSR